MNIGWNEIATDWHRYSGLIRGKWSFLTEKDMEEIAGDKGSLIEKIADRYGLTLTRTECWVDDYIDDLFREAA